MPNNNRNAGQVLSDILEYFPAIKIISLKHRTDRRQRIVRQLQELGIDMKRYGITFFDALKFSDAAGFPTNGVRGCYNSHLKLVRECAESGKPALIMEDDAFFQPNALFRVQNIGELIRTQKWDIIYFGGYVDASNLPQIKSPLTPFSGPIIGSHCVGYNPKAAERFAEYLEGRLDRECGHPDGGRTHFDAANNDYRHTHSDVVTLLGTPNLSTQFASRTDLGMQKWFDNAPVLWPFVERLRTLKQSFQATN
jgi:glycosyl transferase, family 25